VDTSAVVPILPLWAVFLLTIGFSFGAAEIGEQIGKRSRKRQTGTPTDDIGTLVGAMLGLLGFILAITFGTQLSRFDTYRQLELEEATLIEATWLQADMLASPQREQVKNLLAEYLQLRIDRITGDLAQTVDTVARSAKLQDTIWAASLVGTKRSSEGYPLEIYLETLTRLINIQTARITVGLYQRLPLVFWATLDLLVMMAMAVTGYQGGLTGSNRPVVRTMAVIAFAILVLLISDLNRPESGLLRVNKAPFKLVQDRVMVVPPDASRR
jgi:hypothetical protein